MQLLRNVTGDRSHFSCGMEDLSLPHRGTVAASQRNSRASQRIDDFVRSEASSPRERGRGDSLSWRERSVPTTTQGAFRGVPPGPTHAYAAAWLLPRSPANWLRCPSTLWRKWTEHEILTSAARCCPIRPYRPQSAHRSAVCRRTKGTQPTRRDTIERFSNSVSLSRVGPANMSFAVQQQNPWWRYFTLSQVARVF